MMEDWMLPLCLLDYLSMWSENIFIKEILNKGLLKTEKWVTVGSK